MSAVELAVAYAAPAGLRELAPIAPAVSEYNPPSATPRANATQPKKWSEFEDSLLQTAVKHYDGKNWKAISEALPDRSEVKLTYTYVGLSTCGNVYVGL